MRSRQMAGFFYICLLPLYENPEKHISDKPHCAALFGSVKKSIR